MTISLLLLVVHKFLRSDSYSFCTACAFQSVSVGLLITSLSGSERHMWLPWWSQWVSFHLSSLYTYMFYTSTQRHVWAHIITNLCWSFGPFTLRNNCVFIVLIEHNDNRISTQGVIIFADQWLPCQVLRFLAAKTQFPVCVWPSESHAHFQHFYQRRLSTRSKRKDGGWFCCIPALISLSLRGLLMLPLPGHKWHSPQVNGSRVPHLQF